MQILGIDTSGKVASAAILDTERGLLLGEHSVYTTRTQSQVMLPMCMALLEQCGMTLPEVDCFAVTVGPGSYTGLRIGIAAVQGMAMPRNTPCVGVSTLEAMAARLYGVPQIMAVMHARADLFYTAAFSCADGTLKRLLPDRMLSLAEIVPLLAELEAPVLVGDGAEELLRQYSALELPAHTELRIAPPALRLQSAAGVCMCGALREPGTPAELTASYLQAVNITRKG